MGPDFTEEQKRYLEGFFAGLLTRRGAGTGPPPPAPGANGAATIAPAEPAASGPEEIHRAAQDRFLAAGKKLTAEEMAKRAKNPFDMWEEIRANAEAGRFPKGTDVFLHKFHGLFYVAPAQDAFMCRLRIPNGILGAHQLRGIAEIAERYAGGYADVTTRANLQLREIGPKSILDVLTAVQDLGLTTRGAGADNLRNITGSPTAGIDPDELIDTRPLCRELHYTILNHRELYGLPRKFNVGFDGGGPVSVLQDTNDIGFAAVAVGEGEAVAPGVYFRVLLGGITGHGDFGRDTGLLIKPEQCTPVALALVRGFIDQGDRTDRKKARLKYVLERLGLDGFLAEAEKHLSFKPLRFPLERCVPRKPSVKGAHLGVHPQRQAGLFYLGVAVPVGRLTAEQMRSLANIAERHASGTLRLTVWQNLLISDVPASEIAAAEAAVQALGLDLRAGPIRSGLVACTGNTGCKFALTNTKGQALELAEQLEAKVALDRPLNVHLTGCPNSCAQHYLADIGLLGTKVEAGDDMIEGYDVFIGGGAGTEQRLGRPLFRAVPFPELAVKLERVLRTYLGHRRSSEESFRAFSERHSVEELTQLLDAAA
ncbi:MAG TPA: NirA family protein [Xanthobacteraceae bacterium]